MTTPCAMKESTIEKTTCRIAEEELGIKSLKLGGMNERGKSDRIFLRQGKVAFIEFKRPGEKPTALQERNIRERREDGFEADWFDDAGLAIRWLKRVFNV